MWNDMKTAMTALAIILLAQAAPVLAQQRDDPDRPEQADAPRAERSYERPEREHHQDMPARNDRSGPDRPRNDNPASDWRGGRERDAPAPPVAGEPPPAPAAPRARDAGDGGRRGGVYGDSVSRPGPWTLDNGRGDRGPDRGPDRGRDGRGDDTRGGDNRGRGDGDRGDRRGDDRWDRDRGDHGRRDWDRRDYDRHDRGRYDRGQRWERGRYPSVYFSPYRYRYAWRPPSGYYAYNWSFGDFLPRSWYGSGSWLSNPWRYDLPWAPPGYEWVRVGYDALLVDAYNGRIVQVVRNIFW
jgi:hypothetical protein